MQEGEGDPVNPAKKRPTTFWNREIILTSTPTIKDFSRIELAYRQSDQRRYYVPCNSCGTYQTLKWSQVRWPKDKPEEACYVCEVNGCVLYDKDKALMLEQGERRAEATISSAGGNNNIAGFHLNELYSPWVTWPKMAAEFLKAKLSPETLKTFINTSLGETWEEDGEKVDETSLLARKENRGDLAPKGIVIITAGVDVQDDRLEQEIVGFGLGEESWSLDYKVIHGDPARSEIRDDLDNILEKSIRHQSGINMRIAAACIDSGGHHTQSVYSYCKKRQLRRIFAVKGSSITAKALVSRPTIANRMIYSRLKNTKPGPGYCHFPASRDEEYFKQLTSEKIVTRYNKGFPVRKREKPQGRRNEALDCRVYALAALHILSPDLELPANRMTEDRPKLQETETQEASSFLQPIIRLNKQRAGFFNNW